MKTPRAKKAMTNRGWLLRVIGVVVVAAAVAAIGSARMLDESGILAAHRTVCADFTDAVGVYPGNVVSLLGVPVGRVRGIEPHGNGVRITMDVQRDIELPADVGAVVIDNSIVTDRRIEFTKAYTEGPTLSGDGCIGMERTKTPRGISDNFTAVSNLLGDVLGSDGQAVPGAPRTERLADLVDSADRAFSQRGAQINDLMRSFVRLQGDAPKTDAILRRMLKNADILTAQANQEWPNIETTLQTIRETGLAFTGWAEEFTVTLTSAVHFLPTLGRALGNYGDRIVAIIKYLGPWITTLAPYATTIADIIAQIPGLATVTDQIFDRETGALRVMWKPPSVDLRGSDVAGVCAALGKPQGCIVDSSSVGLVQLLLGSAR